MIECELMEVSYNPWATTPTNKIKYGMYSNSHYWSIPGFGRKQWVVIVNINVDQEKYFKEGKTIEEIVIGCIEYLNTPPKSKYGKKRKRKPLYGSFHKKPHNVKLIEKENKKYLQALLIVSDRKRKHFWGQGEIVLVGSKSSRKK